MEPDILQYFSRNDRTVILHDLLTPRFVHYHKPEELRSWCTTSGLTNIRQVPYEANGQTCERTKDILAKYRRVCRPGFGLLARYPAGIAS
ncbi:MAG: hypothetical protein E3K32_02365 [wastewater metagenome]|nr:hypothetical protein [Candidatus Loosdrechtia aerotolerans]